jgi:hypothetical protein
MEVHMNRKLFVTSVLTLVVVQLSGPVAWAGIQPQPFRTGLFGITASQAVRVSLLNVGVEGGVIAPCVEPEPLVGKVAIRGLDGATLFESVTSKLLPGTASFVDFSPLSTATRIPTLSTNRRLPIRVEVSFSEEDLLRIQEGGIALTLEVFDIVTGRTEFTMPFAAVMFNPQHPPDPVAVP